MLSENSPVAKALTDILMGFSKSDYVALGKVSRYMAKYPELLDDRAVLQRVLKAAGLIEG